MWFIIVLLALVVLVGVVAIVPRPRRAVGGDPDLGRSARRESDDAE
jgi:hypothetical protein